MILGRLPLLLVLAIVVSGTFAPAANGAVPGHGRAWELITRSEPMAAIVHGLLAHSPDGDRLAYFTFGPEPDAEAGDLAAVSRATRGLTGWTTEPLGPSYSTDERNLIPSFPVGFSSDLSTAIWLSRSPLTADAPPGGRWALYRRNPNGEPTLLVALGEQDSGNVRTTDDAQRVIFSSVEHLLPADAGRTSGESVYEVDGTTLRMVDVDGSGETLSPCGATVPQRDAVSRSAERIFFTIASGADCSGPERVYMREGGVSTVEVSESECARPDCNAAVAVTFAAATPSGSQAFLTTAQQLTDADLDEAVDLYRYDVEEDELELLSGAGSASAEVVADHVVSSSDGARVYFYADGRLIPDQGAEDATNLYLSDAGQLRLLASLPATRLHTSASGAHALLATSAPLDVADTDGRFDVYRYDVGANAFTRLSSGPVGGNGEFDAGLSEEAEAPLFTQAGPIALHPLSADGAHAFFSTTEPLLSEDANQLRDVYEWSDGGLALVSGGRPLDEANFAGASANGQTVVFRTSATLLPRDRDGGDHDLYAARIGGGFAEPPSPDEEACEAPGCRLPGDSGALDLPKLASAVPPRMSRRGRLRLARVANGSGGRVDRTGMTPVVVFVPAPGLVRAFAWSGARKGDRLVASGRAGAVRAGKVEVQLRFERSVRRRLRHGFAVPIRLVLRLGPERATARLPLIPAGGER